MCIVKGSPIGICVYIGIHIISTSKVLKFFKDIFATFSCATSTQQN